MSRPARLACLAILLCTMPTATAWAQAGRPAQSASLLPRPGLQPLQVVAPAAERPGAAAPSPRAKMYKAALLSALLPGLGEYYSGHSYRALASGSLEASVWASFVTFKVQEDIRGERAIEYAVAFAGARGDADDAYYKAVGMFLRSDGPGMWNEFVRRRERDTGEDVGDPYYGEDGWAWTSIDRFIEYRELRKGKLRAHDRARNAIAFAIANRIVSMVSVVQAVHSDSRQDKEAGFGLKLELGSQLTEPQARVGLWDRF